MASVLKNLKNKAEVFLRSLEPYTNTDMVYLARGGFWLSIGQFVASGSAFLTSIAFANLISPDAFGVYKYIISINSLLLISTLSGMDSAVTQSVARGFDGTLALGVKTKIKWGVLGTITSFFIALYYFLQGNMILSIGFSITAIFIPFIESFDMYNSLLWGKRLFNVQTKYNIIKKIIALLSIIGVIFITKNLYLILLTYLLSIVIPNIFFLYRTNKFYKSNDQVDRDSIKYGKNLSAIHIINIILSELDKILVFQYVGASDLAKYSLASAPTDQIKGLMKNLNSLAMPQFAQRTVEEIKKNIWKKTFVLVAGSTMVVVFYILLAPLFFQMFFPKYLDSILFSRILAISLIPAIVSAFLYTVLESQKAQKQLYEYNVYSSIFGILILIPFIYYFGIWGAIISRFITRIFGATLSIKLVKNLKY